MVTGFRLLTEDKPKVLVEEVSYEEASRYGVLDTNEYGEITEVV